MKRILGLFVDLLFFLSLLGTTFLGVLYVIYLKEHDISVLNVFLQTELTRTMLYVYAGYVVLYLFYFWILPSFLKQTLGQRLAGTSYSSDKKIGLWNVFLKTVVGRFWDILFLPFTLFQIIKKRLVISSKISGIVITKIERKPSTGLYLTTLLFALLLIGNAAAGTYIYKTGIGTIIERLTDYGKQVNSLIDKYAYQDASVSLEKYKQYNGEDANYAFFHCVIEANLSTELTGLDNCTKALEQNKNDLARTKAIIKEEAKLYAANDEYKEAEALYSRLWTEYSDRSLDMKNYVVVLSEQDKAKEATDILNEIAKLVPNDDPVALRDLGDLYQRIGSVDLSFEKYQAALALIPEGENQALAGELHYNIGVVYYTKAKYTEATTSFEQAKLLNKDFAEPVDSYIILISKLKNSVTK